MNYYDEHKHKDETLEKVRIFLSTGINSNQNIVHRAICGFFNSSDLICATEFTFQL